MTCYWILIKSCVAWRNLVIKRLGSKVDWQIIFAGLIGMPYLCSEETRFLKHFYVIPFYFTFCSEINTIRKGIKRDADSGIIFQRFKSNGLIWFNFCSTSKIKKQTNLAKSFVDIMQRRIYGLDQIQNLLNIRCPLIYV